MANICLSIGTTAPVSNILHSLTSIDGLKSWWTSGTAGSPALGGIIEFRFGGNGGFDMKVIKSDDTHVQWECVSGPADSLGTRLEFDIVRSETQNKVMFRHAGWQQENPHFHHCSMKWATFLLSLREQVEGRGGRPFPNDLKIEVVS